VAKAVSDTGLNMRAPSLGSTANGAACEDLWPTSDTGRSASSPKFGPALSADVGTENRRSEANGWKYRRRPTDPKGDRARPITPSIRVKDSPATYTYETYKKHIINLYYTIQITGVGGGGVPDISKYV